MADGHPPRRVRAVVAGAVLVVCAAITAVLVHHRALVNQRTVRERFDAQVQLLVGRLTARMQTYEYALRGARGVLIAIGEHRFDRKLFRAYHESRDLALEFPGAHGYGFIRRVPAADEAAFVAAARADDSPDFTVHQFAAHDGERDVVVYIEPIERNRLVLGLDVASEANRRTALRQSIELGRATLTAPITLVQSVGSNGGSFLLVLPVFRRGLPTATRQDREAAIYGWSYAPLAIDEVLEDFELRDDTIALRLADITAEPRGVAFLTSRGFADAGVDGLAASIDHAMFGRRWRIDVHARPRFVDDLNLISPADLAAIGGAASVLVAALAFAYLLSVQRTTAALEAQVHDRTAALEREVAELADSKLKLTAAVRNHQAMLGTLHQLALVSVTDREGRIRDANPAFCRTSGYTWQELSGQDHRIVSSGVHPPAFWTAMWTTIAGGKPWRGEICNRAKDGALYWMDCMIAPIYNDGGQIEHYVSIRTDITASKAAADELARERQRLDNILRATNVGTWEWNLATGAARVDERWTQMLGRTVADLAPISIRTLIDHVHPDDLAQSMPVLVKHISGELAYYRVELRLKHRDGGWVWTLVRGRITTWTPDGKPEWMYGTQQDISLSKEAQRRLADSEAFLDRAGRLAGIGGWQLALDTQAINWTSEVYRIYEVPEGYQPSAAGDGEFYSPATRAQLQDAIRTSLATRKGWDFEVPFTTAAGRQRWVRVIGEPEFEHDKPVRLVGALQDVTERRHADEALRHAIAAAEAASAAKSEFLANMSHEIRTPLNAVIGLSYLLEQSQLDFEQRGYLAKIQIAGRSLLGVINDVLDLSKIEAGEMALEDAPFALDELLRDIAQLMAPQVEAKGIELRLVASADLPQAVRGDATRLRQILTNLMSNAAKFTELGYIELAASCIAREPDRATLRFAVRDTGIGIAPALRDKLFMPFTQADASTTRRFGGTGLGLTIVRRLAEIMGGAAGVDSTPGVGSEFWVTVAIGTTAAGPAERAGPLQLVEILIADDDVVQRTQLLGMARALGWRAEAVESGDRLVERVTERVTAGSSPDALLVDWRMPGTDGFAALAALAHKIGRDHMPAVLVMSAHDRDTVRRTANAELADAVLTKPITSSKLFDAVNASAVRRGRSRKLSSMRIRRPGLARLPGVRVLVVDDSEINLEVARRILESEGALVEQCGNGHTAVERLRAAPGAFDLVLMDVQMPVMDGNEATRNIRTALGLTALPIIALTAGALVAERQRTLDAGMNAFLSKPLDPQTLIETVLHHAQLARGSEIVAATRTPSPPPSALAWPAIDGIDGAEVAARLGGDVAMFLAMMGHMIDEFADLAVAPRAETAGLVARLHKLRGSAGSLGARRVHRLATDAEAQLKRDPRDPGAARVLHQLAAAVAALVDHARPVLDAHRAQPPRDADPAAPPPSADALRVLSALLAQQDLAALDYVRELGPGLRAACGELRAREISDAVERLEFARAAALVAGAAR